MIHIIIGTKAQLIKVAPIMRDLNKRGIEYNFIFTGQHKETVNELIETFRIKKPDYTLYGGKDITGIMQMVLWGIQCLAHVVRNKKNVFRGQGGIILVHGDTFSALLGMIMGKIFGLKVGYIEAGLRSFNIINPFPEELIRKIISRFTNYHFCPGDFAYQNSQKYKGIVVNTRVNTLYDALQFVLQNDSGNINNRPKEKYAIASIHRFENIFHKKRLVEIINIIENTAKRIKILFILHQPTKIKLQEYHLTDRLINNPDVELRPRYNYAQFINLLQSAEFIITDGGSNQEESYYLGKPCLLLRQATERTEGLQQNVALSRFDPNKINDFLNHLSKYCQRKISTDQSPSHIIIDHIKTFR